MGNFKPCLLLNHCAKLIENSLWWSFGGLYWSCNKKVIPCQMLILARSKLKLDTLNISVFYFQLQIWDTAGQEKFRSITQSYYRAAHGLILVYDVCSQNTFDALPQWLTDIESFANEKVLSYLVGKHMNIKHKSHFRC